MSSEWICERWDPSKGCLTLRGGEIQQETININNIHQQPVDNLDILHTPSTDLKQGGSLQTLIKSMVLSSLQLSSAELQPLFLSLHSNRSLTSLDLRWCHLHPHHATIIAQLIHHNPAITSLNLSFNKLRDEGVVLLSDVLSHSSLTELKLGRNRIGVKGVAALVNAIKYNTTLKDLELTSSFHSPSKSNQSEVGASLLADLLQVNTSLTRLDLSYSNIQAGASRLAQALASNTTLQSLILRSSELSHDGVSAIADMLSVNHSLTELDLACCQLGSIRSCAFAVGLANNTALRSLNLAGNDIGPRGYADMCNAISTHPSLTDVNLCISKPGIQGVEALARALVNNPRIQTLNIACNKLHDDNGVSIIEALKQNTTLTHLDMDMSEITSEAALNLMRALRSNPRLTHISFSLSNLKNLGAVFSAASQIPSLRSLHLGGNRFGDEHDVLKLSEAMASNKTLTEVNLNRCEITASVMSIIAHGLSKNNSIQKLDLSCNQLGDLGAELVAKALIDNKTLSNINLQGNDICETGCVWLFEMLSTNHCITTLDFDHSKASKAMLTCIERHLNRNKILLSSPAAAAYATSAGLNNQLPRPIGSVYISPPTSFKTMIVPSLPSASFAPSTSSSCSNCTNCASCSASSANALGSMIAPKVMDSVHQKLKEKLLVGKLEERRVPSPLSSAQQLQEKEMLIKNLQAQLAKAITDGQFHLLVNQRLHVTIQQLQKAKSDMERRLQVAHKRFEEGLPPIEGDEIFVPDDSTTVGADVSMLTSSASALAEYITPSFIANASTASRRLKKVHALEANAESQVTTNETEPAPKKQKIESSSPTQQ